MDTMLKQWFPGNDPAWQQEYARDRIAARITLLALALLALLPVFLIFKRWMAEVSCSAISVLFLIHSIKTRDWAWLKETPVRLLLCLWLYLLLVSTPVGIDPSLSLMKSALWIRHVLFFSAIVYWLSRYTEIMHRISVWMGFILCLAIVDTCAQYLTGQSFTGHVKPHNRLTGPMGGTVIGIFLAKLTLPVLGLLLYHAWPQQKKRWGCAAIAMAALGVIALSNERTAIIYYTTGLLVAGGVMVWRLPPARKATAGIAAAAIATLMALYASQPLLSDRMSDSMYQLSVFEESPYAQLWKAALEIWRQHSLTGIGLGNFRAACPPLLEAGIINYCDLHPHNFYLEWLAETGIIGFSGFIAFGTSLFYLVIRRLRHAKGREYILISFALAGLSAAFFPFKATQSFFINWPAMLVWLSIALSVSFVQRIKHE